jgi:cation transport regulator ChaC
VGESARWVFGYGSLLWRPGFPHRERVVACLPGMARRFWQGSPDHRGRPAAPGRVVTLASDPEASCWGAAYRVDPAEWRAVQQLLDARESGGFERLELEVRFAGGQRGARALVYMAPPGNPNFLGSAPLDAMAEQVRRARGRSGTNVDYVMRLAAALRAQDAKDEHVFALAERVGSD